MAGLNMVQIIGHLGQDPEMKFMPSGEPVTNFSVAVSRKWKNNEGEDKEETEWFNVVVFSKQAESCNQFLAKGRLVYVQGRLRTRSWDGQDGVKHYRTEVIAGNVIFLSAAKAKEKEEQAPDYPVEDIPF
jgi:single-strand DNA-binding protein